MNNEHELSQDDKQVIQSIFNEYLDYVPEIGRDGIEQWFDDHRKGVTGKVLPGYEKFTAYEHYLEMLACVNVLTYIDHARPLHDWLQIPDSKIIPFPGADDE